MKRGQLILAVAALLLSIAVYSVRLNVSKIQRSQPSGSTLTMSHAKKVGQRGVVEQRLGRTKEGLPLTVLRLVLPAGDTMNGAYKGHPSSPPPHIHLYQSEKFTVLRGKAGYVLDGVEGSAGVGQSITLPHGDHPHTFWNFNADEDLEVQVDAVTHVGNSTYFASFIETFFGLSRDYGSPDKVNPLQLLLTFQEGGHLELPVPKAARWLIRYVACPLAKLVGYKPVYDEYRAKGA